MTKSKKILLLCLCFCVLPVRIFAGPCSKDLKNNKQINREVKEAMRKHDRKKLYVILEAHKEELSDGCKKEIERLYSLRKELITVCSAEVDKACKYVKSETNLYTESRFVISNCLRPQINEISIDCRAEMYELNEDLFGVDEKGSCFEDQQKFCKKVIPGRHRMAKCLLKHVDQVSSDCRADKFHLATA